MMWLSMSEVQNNRQGSAGTNQQLQCGYRIEADMQNSIAFLYICNEQLNRILNLKHAILGHGKYRK